MPNRNVCIPNGVVNIPSRKMYLIFSPSIGCCFFHNCSIIVGHSDHCYIFSGTGWRSLDPASATAQGGVWAGPRGWRLWADPRPRLWLWSPGSLHPWFQGRKTFWVLYSICWFFIFILQYSICPATVAFLYMVSIQYCTCMYSSYTFCTWPAYSSPSVIVHHLEPLLFSWKVFMTLAMWFYENYDLTHGFI